jgi:hypothetical protein
VTGAPAGVAASFSPLSSPGSTTLSLATSASPPAGSSALTITGTSGALSATTTVALTVNAAPPPPAPGGGPATVSGKAATVGPWYDEEQVLFSTSSQITALTVTISVPAANVSYNGAYNTFGGQVVNSHVAGANIVYSFTLSPGQSIGPGSGLFAAQLSGNGVAHSAAGDSWTATYTSGGTTYTQSGGF